VWLFQSYIFINSKVQAFFKNIGILFRFLCKKENQILRVYLDNASTTPVLPSVVQQMNTVLSEGFGNPSSIHWHGRMGKSLVENSRKVVARAINASLGEVFFTSCATEANNMVLRNSVESLGVKRIISSPTEHHSVLHTLHYIEKFYGTEIVILPVDRHGNIDLNELEQNLTASNLSTLVSIMHTNNETGTIAPVELIGQLCSKHGALFHCDAVQAIGKMPVNVQQVHMSFMTSSAHKFHGPKGIGFVFINNDNILPPFIHGGAQERNMRAGTENVAGIVGLGAALEYACENQEENYNKVLQLRKFFKKCLETEFSDIKFNGNQDHGFMPHILSVSFPPGPKAEMLVMNLDIAGISASSGSACSAGIEEDSHVMQALHHSKDRKTIRFSFSALNTEDELIYTIENLKKIT
jgi:cysteine desulfurase